MCISQGALLSRTRRHWKVRYQGWTDNSDVNKRLPLGTWIAHQAARGKIKGRRHERKSIPILQRCFSHIWTSIIFWSKLMQQIEKEVREDFDGWSASCVFEEQRKSLKMNLLSGGSGVKTKVGDEGGQKQILLTPSKSKQARGKATVMAEVTNSPLQILVDIL